MIVLLFDPKHAEETADLLRKAAQEARSGLTIVDG